MAEYEIRQLLPSAEDYNRLRKAVGWVTYDVPVIELSLPKSLYCVCAMLNDRIVGMARVVGDGGLVFYIQDVIVEPEHQRRGIGTRLMDRIMDYLRSNASNNSMIGLMSARGKEPFYEKYGFTVRPNGRLGAGMQIVWKGDAAWDRKRKTTTAMSL